METYLSQKKRRPAEEPDGVMTEGVVGAEHSADPGHWAVSYAAGGLAVLPLHTIRNGRCTCNRDCGKNIGKHPLIAHGKDAATSDPEQVAEWTARWPWCNWGIRPPVGVIVLDVDPRNHGDTALLALTEQHGKLPETLTARTGGGGLHFWLNYAGHTRGKLCPGVDVKTNSGYLVAPPSLHASGRRYEWWVGAPTARAPRWVRRLLAPAPAPVIPRQTTGGQIDPLVRYIEADPGGELNNRLYWSCCRAHESGLAVAPLVAAAVALGHPERTAWATANSAAKAPARPGGC